VEDGVNGFLFNAKSFDETVDKFCRAVELTRNKSLRARLTENAISRVESNYSIAVYIPKLLEIYQRVTMAAQQ